MQLRINNALRQFLYATRYSFSYFVPIKNQPREMSGR